MKTRLLTDKHTDRQINGDKVTFLVEVDNLTCNTIILCTLHVNYSRFHYLIYESALKNSETIALLFFVACDCSILFIIEFLQEDLNRF